MLKTSMLIQEESRSVDELLSRCEALSEEQMQVVGVTREWSTKDLLGHLAHFEQSAAEQVRELRAGTEFPYLLRGALLPMRQMPQQVLSGPLPRHADHLHLLLAERFTTREQLVDTAAFLLDQHRRFQHLGPFLAHRRQAFYSFCDDHPLFPDTDRPPHTLPTCP